MWTTVDKVGENCVQFVDNCWKTMKQNCNIFDVNMKIVKAYALLEAGA